MSEPSSAQQIAAIRRLTQLAVQQAVVQIEQLGGPEALDGFFREQAFDLAVAATAKQGSQLACALMWDASQIAECLAAERIASGHEKPWC